MNSISKIYLVTSLVLFSISDIKSEIEANVLGNSDLQNAITTYKNHEAMTINCTQSVVGVVRCTNGNVAEINNALKQFKGKIKLSILRSKFPNEHISRQWLTVRNIDVDLLYIENCNFNQIEDDAFNSEAFRNTKSLSLRTANISRLSKSTFAGLTNLKDLEIVNSHEHLQADHPLDVLSNLETFSLQSSIDIEAKQTNLFDLLHTSSGNKITKLKLAGVLVGDQFVHRGSISPFRNYKALAELSMSNCKVRNITEQTFAPIYNTIKAIDLSRNEMENYPVGSFTKFLQKDDFIINLTQNHWYCDCQLMHFIEEYSKYHELKKYKGNVVCQAPSEHRYKALSKIELDCAASDTLNITCNPKDCSNCTNSEFMDNDLRLEVKNSSAVFQIQQLQANASRANITLESGDGERFAVLVHAIDKEQKNNYNCSIASQNSSITLEYISPGIAYTVCVVQLQNPKNSVSPFDCKSYEAYSNGSIAENESQNLQSNESYQSIYLIFIASMLISFIVGFNGMYFVLRLNPIWLRKSQKVLNVNRESKTIMISEADTRKLKLCKSETATSTESRQSQPAIAHRRSSDPMRRRCNNKDYIIPNNLYEAVNYEQRYSVIY